MKTKMKTKVATILLVLMSLATLPMHADEPAPSTAQLELKIKQIELDVALKQFEKVSTTLAEAELDDRLADPEGKNDEQIKAQRNSAERKIAILTEMKDRLRGEILKNGVEIEALRKKWGIPAPGPEKNVKAF